MTYRVTGGALRVEAAPAGLSPGWDQLVLLNEQWASGQAPWKRWGERRTKRSSQAEFRPKLVS